MEVCIKLFLYLFIIYSILILIYCNILIITRYLLNIFPWDSTKEKRNEINIALKYEKMK